MWGKLPEGVLLRQKAPSVYCMYNKPLGGLFYEKDSRKSSNQSRPSLRILMNRKPCFKENFQNAFYIDRLLREIVSGKSVL